MVTGFFAFTELADVHRGTRVWRLIGASSRHFWPSRYEYGSSWRSFVR